MTNTREFQLVIDTLLEEDVKLNGAQSVSGGSINEAYLLDTSKGRYFVKKNRSDSFPGMFEAEKKGLKLLAAPNTLGVPQPIGVVEEGNMAFLLMEYIEPGARDDAFWNGLGKGLSRLHRVTIDRYGLDHDNYMGSLPQKNEWRESWSDFFAENRLLPQTKLAVDCGLLNKGDIDRMEEVCKRLEEIFPDEPPALVHGDLWSGNYLAGQDGAYIIDPAAYYGHREIDIAMTKLFGGFDGSFYDYYNDENPLAPGWEDRVDICNLYPLLIHVNLFGGGYVGSVRRIIERF